jgi:hypothetical protein
MGATVAITTDGTPNRATGINRNANNLTKVEIL